MKPNKIALSLFVYFGVAASLPAAISPGDETSYYDAANWYSFRSNAKTTISANENSVTFGGLDAKNSYSLAYLDRVSLSLGDTYSVSGTLRYTNFDATDGVFVFGLFDSVNNPENAIPANTNKAGISTYTSSMSGILATTGQIVYRPLDSSFGFLAFDASGKREFFDYATPLASPENGVNYDFALDLTKTESGFDVSVSIGGIAALPKDSETFSVITNTLSAIDVLGLRFGSATKGSVTLSNLKIATTGTVIPEPSAFGLFAGIAALALVASRRRKR